MTVGLIAEVNSNGGNNGIIVTDNSLLNAIVQQISVTNVGINYIVLILVNPIYHSKLLIWVHH